MNLMRFPLYREEVKAVADLPLEWDRLAGRSLLLTGSTGLIGSFLCDVLMDRNTRRGLGCRVFAQGRSPEKAVMRFLPYLDNPLFTFLPGDVTRFDDRGMRFDYLVHAASTTHPRAYAADPIGTIESNVSGLKHLLEMAAEGCERLMFLSSVEVYGENRGDTEAFDEGYCGYLDCNTLRADYSESKRLCEAMCQAYMHQKDVDVVIPRLARTFGAGLLRDDSKALSQFLFRGASGEDIILKSAGKQVYSFLYVPDAVSGILTCLLRGKRGEAYNVASDACSCMLRDAAQMIADLSGVSLRYEQPDAVEASGYSRASRAVMDSRKLAACHWQPAYSMREALQRTLAVLRESAQQADGHDGMNRGVR